MLLKICNGNLTKWDRHVAYVFWAERITTSRRTGFSPYYAAHGVEPLLPLDISEATYLFPDVSKRLSTEELLAIRARQLERRDEDLALIHERVVKARLSGIVEFMKKHKNTIVDYDFKEGELVLVLNKKIEKAVGRKGKPRYFGPMLVVKHSQGGSYRLAELDGAVSKLRYAAFRLIPYYPRSRKTIKVTEIVDAEVIASLEEAENVV